MIERSRKRDFLIYSSAFFEFLLVYSVFTLSRTIMKLPPRLKPLTPFVRRAAELDRAGGDRERMMSYFRRSYAMELGIKLNDNSEEVKGVLLGLMGQLEKDKATLPSYDGKDEAKQFVEGFALEIFKKADDKDRAGLADKGTARTFYAADTFFQTLKQFGDLEPDLKETSLYAKWKATDILKALKEGRRPTPGPPGGEDDAGSGEDSHGGGGGGGAAQVAAPLQAHQLHCTTSQQFLQMSPPAALPLKILMR